jgi:biopolymer transport protein ExbB
MQKLKNFTAASLLGMSTLLPLQAVFAEKPLRPLQH